MSDNEERTEKKEEPLANQVGYAVGATLGIAVSATVATAKFAKDVALTAAAGWLKSTLDP
jgi:hypothetical protein